MPRKGPRHGPTKGIPIQSVLMGTFLPAVVIMAVIMAALVYQRLYATILNGFDRNLVTTSALTGALIDPVDHAKLEGSARAGRDRASAETLPEYRRNVQPIQKIRGQLKLTYLYTQVFGGAQDVIYILDGNSDANHSPPGAEDSLPDDTLAELRAAMGAGRVHIAPIEYQEQWGLLKSATAPMRDRDGRVAAMAGADVEISVIRVATQNALFASALIGIISLAISALAALVIVSRVGTPIKRLKLEALRIAAGDHAPPARFSGPGEALAMRDSLGQIASSMQSRLTAAQQDDALHEQEQSERILEAALARDARSPVIFVDNAAELVIWLGCTGTQVDHALQRRAMAALARRIRQEPTLAASWQTLLAGTPGTILMLDRQAHSVRLTGQEGVVIQRLDQGTDIRLQPGEEMRLAGDERLRLAEGNIHLPWWPAA